MHLTLGKEKKLGNMENLRKMKFPSTFYASPSLVMLVHRAT
jgi:hypothetical protein